MAEPPRIAVYTIVCDEEEQLERWARSAADADALVVADTGSSDATVERARALGIEAHEIRIEPFRFDDARNAALDLIPADVDVCLALDADEVLVPGWRDHLERAWRGGATRMVCSYEWRWSDEHPPLRFSAERAHARRGYCWRSPVHEQLVALGAETVARSGVEIRHLRDPARSRPSYLELLRLGVRERPDDGRMVHMLANEARLQGLTEEARRHFGRALELGASPDERLHCLLMLSHLEPELREGWIADACSEFPARREPWCELAQLHFERGAWRASRRAAHAALRVERGADDYLANVFAWGAWPERLAALASARLGDGGWAGHHARRALRQGATDDELDELSRHPSRAGARRRRGRPRVAVYAIARDEEHRLDAWAASAREADVLVIADTGSSDATVERARALGVEVHAIRVEPFRFDEARNRALDLLPPDVDICVPLDLDEVLTARWRQHLDRAWEAGATRVVYTREWPWSEAHPPARFNERKIHARHGYRWRSPVHEQVVAVGDDDLAVEAPLTVVHLRNPAEPRPAYLPLLRLGVREDPSDGRMAHMLASELCSDGRPREASDEARRALELALGDEDRMLTLLLLSRAEPDARQSWILDACRDFPHWRDPWCELAQLHLERGDWRACLGAARAALRIVDPPDHYLVNAGAWGHWPEQLAALASAELGDDDAAISHARRAHRALPEDPTLAEQLRRFTAALAPTRPSSGAPKPGRPDPGDPEGGPRCASSVAGARASRP